MSPIHSSKLDTMLKGSVRLMKPDGTRRHAEEPCLPCRTKLKSDFKKVQGPVNNITNFFNLLQWFFSIIRHVRADIYAAHFCRDQVRMQSTFKVDLVIRDNGTNDQPAKKQRPFATRKTHQKSRNGCLACKRRRIKCDESRPNCTRCSRLNVDCEYIATGSPSTSTEVSTSSPTPLGHNLAVASAKNDLVQYLGTPVTQRNSDIRALRHFQDLTCNTFGGDVVNKTMHLVVSKDVWEVPYLMHMVLAVSSGHQRRLLDVHGQQKQLRVLEFAEASHWHRGLQLYQADLARKVQPSEVTSDTGFDAVVAAMLITIVFTFSLEDGSAHNDRPASDNEFITRILNPMASTGGFRALQLIYNEPGRGSPWAEVFYAADDDVGSFTSDEPGIEGLPPAFVRLCELDGSSTSHADPYHKILRHLTPLLVMKLNPKNMNKIFAFGGRLHTTFRPLVMQKDIRALLLLSWWLALLRQVDEWWVKAWARASCRSVVAHLSSLQDPKIQALLVYPATFGTADFSWIWREEN